MGYRYRWMYRLTGLPGWMRFGFSPGWLGWNPWGLPPMALWMMGGYQYAPQAQAQPSQQTPPPQQMPQMPWMPQFPQMTPEDEKRFIKEQIKFLEEQLKALKDRLKELEGR